MKSPFRLWICRLCNTTFLLVLSLAAPAVTVAKFPVSVNPQSVSAAICDSIAPATDYPENDFVEVPAAFPGGDWGIWQFISKNIRYPKTASGTNVNGVVGLRFLVNTTGQVTSVRITHHLTPTADQEAMRLVRSLPSFQPARQNGRPIPVWCSIPIRFQGDPDQAYLPRFAATQHHSAGQTECPDEADKYPDNALAEAPATYPGGAVALSRYISENLQYPVAAIEAGVQGVVVVRFLIGADGKVGTACITKSLTPETDREAVRLVQSLARFTPARQHGRPVPVWFTIPIRFQMR